MATKVIIFKRCNKIVSYQAGVGATLEAHAQRMAAIAWGVLSEHRHAGDAEITVTKGKLDRYVNLDDTRGQRAAAAIEFGHFAPNGRWVEGIHAITRSFRA